MKSSFPKEFTVFIPNAVGCYLYAARSRPLNEETLLAMLAPKPETEVQVEAGDALAGYHYDQLLDYTLNSEDGSQHQRLKRGRSTLALAAGIQLGLRTSGLNRISKQSTSG
ncbi:MAG TPA: hypothetical protein VJ805_00230 [Nitrospiraceae bacterium]|nr:hypothetical protein [Nitrospiraceae bacterium]